MPPRSTVSPTSPQGLMSTAVLLLHAIKTRYTIILLDMVRP